MEVKEDWQLPPTNLDNKRWDMQRYRTSTGAAPGPVLVLGFLDVAPVRVVGAGVHSVHHHVAPPRLVQLCLQQPGTTTNNIKTK